VCLKRGPLSLVSTIEELPEIKNTGPRPENLDYGRRDTGDILYPQMLALSPSTSVGGSVGVRSRTQAMKFFIYLHGNLDDTKSL
jgi:hypothetical protein